MDVGPSPDTAHVWGLSWQQNVSLNQLMDKGPVMWAAKWLDEKVVLFDSGTTSHKAMLRVSMEPLSQADTVIHYNGTKFDIPTLNKEFLVRWVTSQPLSADGPPTGLAANSSSLE